MEAAEEFFYEIVASLPDAKLSKMFGALCFKAPNGKAAAMYWKGDMVFKLTGEDEKEALSLDGASYFDPMGNRPMQGWVQIPYHYKDRWKEFAKKSLGLAKTLR